MDKHTPELFEKGVERISEAQRELAEQLNQMVEASLNSTMRMVELNINAAQESFQRNIRLIDEVKGLKDGNDIVALQERVRESETAALTAQADKVNALCLEMQDAMEKIVKDGFERINRQVNESIGQAFTFPGADLFRQGIEAQRKAMSQASELAQQNWRQSIEQVRKAAEQGAGQLQAAKAKGRGKT